jgi:GDP-4-dehydro-6-deoxy-D-mannose reductase
VKALVTGITGFAGSHLAEHLLACGDRVLGCSQHAQWHDDAPPQLSEQIELCRADLRDEWQARFVEQVTDFAPDCIYHLGALSVPIDCGTEEPTASAIATNVEGTRRVLQLAAELSAAPRVVVVSSSHIYGNVDATNPIISEETPCQPSNGYGLSKQYAEQLVQTAVREQGVQAVIARAFQHAGPRQSQRMMLSEWCHQMAISRTRPVYVHCLDAHIDVTDVRDVVRAYRELALQGEVGGTYNVGSGISVRSGDLLEKLSECYGTTREIVEVYPQRQQNPIANITQLVDCCGWQPEIPLERTIADTLAYWQEQTVR